MSELNEEYFNKFKSKTNDTNKINFDNDEKYFEQFKTEPNLDSNSDFKEDYFEKFKTKNSSQQNTPTDEDVGFLDNTYRTVVGAGRDTLQGASDLLRDVTFGNVDLPDLPEVAEPTNMVGSIARDIIGFAVPYTGGVKLINSISKLNKLKAPTTFVGKSAKAGTIGVAAEQVAFSPDEERLSNLIQDIAPNQFTDWLEADDNDSVAKGRLKMAVEGFGIGVAFDSIFAGLRGIKNKYRKVPDEEGTATGSQQDGGTIIQDTNIDSARKFRDEEVAEGTAPPNREGFAGNVNLDKKDFNKSQKSFVQQQADENERFWNARRGRVAFGSDGTILHAAAKGRGWTVDDVLNIQQGTSLNAEDITAVRQIVRDAELELFDVAKDYNARRLSGSVNETDKLKFSEFQEIVNRLSAKESGVIAESGRTQRALQESAKAPNQKIAEKIRRKVLEDLKNTNLDPDVLAARLSEFDDTKAMVDYLKEAHRPTIKDMLTEVWINGLLSSPSTQLVNLLSGVLTAGMRPLEFYTGAAIGKLTRNPEALTFNEANARLFGTIAGAIEGMGIALKSIKNPDAFVDDLTKIELNKQKSIKSKLKVGEFDLVGDTIRTPSRVLVGVDTGLKAAAYRQEIYGQAMRKANKEGLKGNAAWKRTNELVKGHYANKVDSPLGKTMDYKAADVGRYQTFTRELGKDGKGVQSFINRYPAMRFLLPFVRTPVNIVKYAGERTPFGFMAKEFKEKLAKGGAERDEVLGRLLFGSSTMLTVGFLAGGGLITGQGPKDLNERRTMMATGWRPYSIKIGNEYYSYNRFEPVGILFGIAADLQEVGNYVYNSDSSNEADKLEMDKLLMMLTGTVTNNLTNKTFLSGISSAIQTIADPSRYGDRFVQRFTGSFVPTVFAHVSQLDDPVLRDVRNVTDNFLARIGQSEQFAARRDIFGTLRTPDSGLFGAGPLSPIRSSALNNDPVYNEFMNVGFYPSMPRREVNGIELNPNQYERLLLIQQELGSKRALERIIKSSGYLNGSKAIKNKILQDTMRTFQDAAKQILLSRDKDLLNKFKDKQINQFR